MKAVRFIALLVIVATLAAVPAQAQGDGGGGGTSKPKKSAPAKPKEAKRPTPAARPARSNTPAAPRPPVTITKTKTVFVPVPSAPTTVTVVKTATTLTISVPEAQAVLTLERLVKNKWTVFQQPVAIGPSGSRTFSKIPPGTYRATVECPGYHTAESDEIIVKPEQVTAFLVRLESITHDVEVTFNISAGKVQYRVSEETKVENIVGGKAKLPNLRPGSYSLIVEPEQKIYKIKETTLVVAADHSGATHIDLEKRPAAEAFVSGSASDWNMPVGWNVSDGIINLKRTGVALPSREEKRSYQDFRLITNVRMDNGRGIGVVIRAADEKNYYLLRFAGTNAPTDRLTLSAFIVQNGVAKKFGNTASLGPALDALKSGQFVELTIYMKGNTISVFYYNPDEADDRFKQVWLGAFTDLNSTFGIGAVGLFVGEQEQSAVNSFQVCVIGNRGCPAPPEQ